MTSLIDIVEIDLERCHLTYGEGLCQAALGVTGDRKCYNGLGTCQDRVNFDAASAGTPAVPAGIGGYLGQYGSTAGTTAVHSVAIPYGAEAVPGSVREIVLAISVQGSPTLSGVTIGGVTATIDASRAVSTTSRVYIVRAAVPAGTSGTAVLTFSANLAQAALRVGVFRLIDVDSVADSDGVNGVNTSGPTTVSLSLDVPANSYVIAAATTVFLFGSTTMTGVTRRYSQSISSGVAYATAGSDTVVEADDTFSITASAIEDAPINLIAVAYKLHDYEAPVPAEPEGNLATWRFARPSDYLPESGIDDVIPSIVSIRHVPGEIEPGEGLGRRATLTVELQEHRWADTGPNGDKYLADRPFDPAKTGTFWGKFTARNPYLRGRTLRYRQGLLGRGLEGFETRNFIIERIEGPSADGIATITAHDPMQLLFTDRSQCPRPSRGQLATGITAAATSAALVPAGIGDAEYPEDGWLNFSGTEIVGFSRTGDTLNLAGGRGLWGTAPADHEAGARVQLCVDFIADDPADALYRLMTEFGDVPTSVINLADWQDETAAFYQGGRVTTLVAEPTPTEDLATEMIREVGLSTWWDEVAARQRLQVLRPIDTDALVLDDRFAPGEANVLAGSGEIADQPDKRKSRVMVYYGQVNPIEGIDEKNLPSSVVAFAAQEEKDEGSKELDTIYSRWIQSGGLGAASAVAARRLARYVRAPRRIMLEVPRWGSLQPQMGQGCLFRTELRQDDQGLPETIPCQIVSVDPTARGGAAYGLVLEELRFNPQFKPEVPPNTVVLTVSELNVNFRTKFLQGFADLEPGDTATLIINEGVAIGSRAIDLPALDLGAWPAGINIEVITRGTISGKGGDGAKGRGGDNNAGYDGQDGGLALRTTVPFKLSGTGRIQGGGAGGGGGAGDYAGLTGPQRDGGGAGGGAGWPPGAGGAAGGNAEAGQPGTLLAGGAGGRGRSGSGLSNSQHKGGNGGAPGAAGGNANGYSPGQGGNPGLAVDGISLVDTTDWTGTIVGATIN